MRLSRKPATMTPGEINAEIGRLDRISFQLVDALIAAGRGHEKVSQTVQKDDPLSRDYKAVLDRQAALRDEIRIRMGPGWVSMGRGFKRRETRTMDRADR